MSSRDNMQVPEVRAFSDYKAVLDRPLNAENRRPPAVSASHSTLAAQWRVSGVVRVGEREIVLLRDDVKRQSRRVKIGEELDGWLLHSVATGSVVFVKDDQKVLLPYGKED